jgi:hypothetical protein
MVFQKVKILKKSTKKEKKSKTQEGDISKDKIVK